MEKFRRIEIQTLPHGLEEALLAIFLKVRAGHFIETIGETNNEVIAFDGTAPDREDSVFKKAESGAVPLVIMFQGLGCLMLAGNPQRARVAGIDKAQLLLREVEGQIHGGGHERFLGLLQNHVQAVIDRGEKFSGIRRRWLELFNETTHNRGNQGSAHAVTHNVANEYPSNSIGNGKNVEKIAAHCCCRQITMSKGQSTLRG